MIYPEKAYISAAQALARAATEQAYKTRARIIELMINAEQPADRARARELVGEEEEPPDQGLDPIFLTGCEADPCAAIPGQKPKPKSKI